MARFKIDENFGTSVQQLFSGHDCHTVRDEGLGGASDKEVFAAAVREHRILVTLDLDFANVLAFPPEDSSGIIVIRPTRGSLTIQRLRSLIHQTLAVLQTKSVDGRFDCGSLNPDASANMSTPPMIFEPQRGERYPS